MFVVEHCISNLVKRTDQNIHPVSTNGGWDETKSWR